MTGETADPILEHIRHVRLDIGDLRQDVIGLKRRVGHHLEPLGSVDSRLDHVES